MRFRDKFITFLLLLLCVCHSVANTSDSSEEDWDLTKEEDSNYDDRYEKEERKNPVHRWKFDSTVVCEPNGDDYCECEKTSGSINCRFRNRRSKSGGKKISFFNSAAITVKLGNFTSKYVYLTGNRITSLSSRTLMPEIAETILGLDVSFNEIENIEPNTFEKMTNLRKLRLNHNFLTTGLEGWITSKLGEKLELLNLGYNYIENIKEGSFDKLTKLRRLYLDGNAKLTLTDGTFGNNPATASNGLFSLTELSLDNCNLTNLPDKLFVNLPNLQNLSLIGNLLTSVPAAMKSIGNLITLDFSKNPFTKWDSNMLQDNPTIKKLLLLDMDTIKSYGKCAFCGMSNLTIIELSDSKQLESLDKDAFGYPGNKLTSLKRVIFDNCNLTTLNEKMIPYDQLDAFGISKNPWNCDKDLQWLIKDKNLHLFVGDGPPECASPPKLKGKAIQKLSKEQQVSSSGGIGFLRSIFYMGIAIGIVATTLVGVLLISKRFKVLSFNRQRTAEMGFSNLNANIEEEGNVFEDDDEFQVRPAAV